jgi:hypothetical protein
LRKGRKKLARRSKGIRNARGEEIKRRKNSKRWGKRERRKRRV